MLLQPSANPQTATAFFYLGVLLTALNVIDKIVIWFRGGQAPVLTAIAKTEKDMIDRITRIELDVRQQVAALRTHIDESIEDGHGGITRELNGWSMRINDNKEEINRNSKAIEDIVRAHVEFKSESKADRGHMTTRLVSVESKVEGVVTAQTQMELRLVNALGASERRLADMIRRIPNAIDKNGNGDT